VKKSSKPTEVTSKAHRMQFEGAPLGNERCSNLKGRIQTFISRWHDSLHMKSEKASKATKTSKLTKLARSTINMQRSMVFYTAAINYQN
jgi:hypothetical protein